MRRHGLLLILVATFALSGCLVPPPISARGGDAARSASATEQAPGAGKSPSAPPEAREQTPEGAVAFTRHWWDVVNHVRASADAQPLRDLTDSGCRVCAMFLEYAVAASFDPLASEGPWLPLQAAKAEPLDPAGTTVVHTEHLEGPAQVYVNGEVVGERESEILRLAFHLRFADGQWVLDEIFPG